MARTNCRRHGLIQSHGPSTRLTRLLGEVGAAHGVDLFALTGQPPMWQGVANPFAALTFQRSPDDARLAQSDNSLLRDRLRSLLGD